jgi:NAD(P)-dependent dehydrogenase (short-subunit alcohol dehydrogenase family)
VTTGGSDGIGAATARRLFTDGVTVAATDESLAGGAIGPAAGLIARERASGGREA